jgi:hypothetical protein
MHRSIDPDRSGRIEKKGPAAAQVSATTGAIKHKQQSSEGVSAAPGQYGMILACATHCHRGFARVCNATHRSNVHMAKKWQKLSDGCTALEKSHQEVRSTMMQKFKFR